MGSSAKTRFRLVNQRPGACYALLLTAGELAGTMRETVLDTQLLDQVTKPVPVDLGARQVGGQGDVLGRGERRDEVEGLEDEADVVTAQPGETGVVEPSDILATHERLPRCRPVETRHAVHQGRLARARRAHHGGEPAPFEGHVDASQGVHGRLPGPVRLAQVHGVRRRAGLDVVDRFPGCERHASSPRSVKRRRPVPAVASVPLYISGPQRRSRVHYGHDSGHKKANSGGANLSRTAIRGFRVTLLVAPGKRPVPAAGAAWGRARLGHCAPGR